MILVLDPGLASCGASLFDTAGELVGADVFTSSPGKKPKGARGAWFAADLGRRAHDLSSWLRDWTDRLDGIDDLVVIESFGAGGAAGSAVIQMAIAAGAIRAVVSEAVAPQAVEYVTPDEWRAFLGWRPAPRPKRPVTKGITKAAKAAALKAHRAEVAALKRDDDARLYALLRELRGGDELEPLVLAHGRRRSDTVHAWDAFGIGRAVIARRARAAHEDSAARDAA